MNEEGPKKPKKPNLTWDQREVLYALQRSIIQPEWHYVWEVPAEKSEKRVRALLDQLAKKGLVERNGSKCRLTEAGKLWKTFS